MEKTNNVHRDYQLQNIFRGHMEVSWLHAQLAHNTFRYGHRHPIWRSHFGKLTLTPNEVIGKITEFGGRIIIENLAPNDLDSEYVQHIYVWEEAAVTFSYALKNNVGNAAVVCSDPELFKKLDDFFTSIFTRETQSGRIYTVASTRNGPALREVGMASIAVERGNYTPDVIAEYDHITEDLASSSPCGRIILFDGKPGTGKTYLVRGIIDSVKEAVFVMVPPGMVASLVGPDFVNVLISTHQAHNGAPIVLVIEDADSVLVPRGADNMGSISALLNLSDGIMGSLLDLRFIATTNAGHLKADEAIDEAILRPGRLCRRVHVGEIDRAQATEVYKRLTGKEPDFSFDSRATIAEVYRLARDGGWKPPKRKASMGFSSPHGEVSVSSRYSD